LGHKQCISPEDMCFTVIYIEYIEYQERWWMKYI
jgi:hypothetical protein